MSTSTPTGSADAAASAAEAVSSVTNQSLQEQQLAMLESMKPLFEFARNNPQFAAMMSNVSAGSSTPTSASLEGVVLSPDATEEGSQALSTLPRAFDDRVVQRFCDDCKVMLCRCEFTKYPECFKNCNGCTPDESCHNAKETVDDVHKRENSSIEAVAQHGIVALLANIVNDEPAGLAHAPSHERFCTQPRNQVEETTVRVKSAPMSHDETEAPTESLFLFFDRHPELAVGRARFYTRLNAHDTEHTFKSVIEAQLDNHNTNDDQFARTTHPAQNLWQHRDAHIVPREITLKSTSSQLPGEWSTSFETLATPAPDDVFREYYAASVASRPDGPSIFDNMKTSEQVMETIGADRSEVNVVTHPALSADDLEHMTLDSNAESVLLDESRPPNRVRPDADGFRGWANQGITGFWAKFWTHTKARPTIKEQVAKMLAKKNASTDTSAASATAAAAAAEGEEEQEEEEEEEEEVEGRMRHMTLRDDDTLTHGAPKDRDRHVRVHANQRLVEKYVPAVHITQFQTTSGSVPVFKSYISNCYVSFMTTCMGIDYAGLLAGMKNQLHLSRQQLGQDGETSSYSSIEVCDANNTCLLRGRKHLFATNFIAKLALDTTLPYLARKNADLPDNQRGNKRDLRCQYAVADDLLKVFSAVNELLMNDVRALIPAAWAVDQNKAAGDADTQLAAQLTPDQTARVLKKFRSHIKKVASNVHVQLPQSREDKRDAYAVKRLSEFHAGVTALQADVEKRDNLIGLLGLLRHQHSELLIRRVKIMNALFRIGCACVWRNGDRIEMFINYTTMLRYSLTSINTIRWWTHCADLRAGVRVAFEWADASISLSDKLKQLEQHVSDRARMYISTNGAFDSTAAPLEVGRILRSTQHPLHRHVLLAIDSLSPEDRAWFTTDSVASTWHVCYTPVWKHIVVRKTDVLSSRALTAGAPSETGDAHLEKMFSREIWSKVRAQTSSFWSMMSYDSKERILQNAAEEAGAGGVPPPRTPAESTGSAAAAAAAR